MLYQQITQFDEIISLLQLFIVNMMLNSGWELLGVIQPPVIFLTPAQFTTPFPTTSWVGQL